MATICGGCQRSVEPNKVFEKSPKSSQWWRISKCPNERCGFNLDIEKCDKPAARYIADKEDGKRSFWKGDHWG